MPDIFFFGKPALTMKKVKRKGLAHDLRHAGKTNRKKRAMTLMVHFMVLNSDSPKHYSTLKPQIQCNNGQNISLVVKINI